MTNYTTVLIRIDVLTRDLNNGCPNWIDVNGRTYGPDEQTAGPSNTPLPRSKNRKWQRDLTRYLRSGDAIILVSPRLSGIVGHTAKVIKQGGVLARVGRHTVYRVRR